MQLEDEISARLEVAALYEELGEPLRAARYLASAAELAFQLGDPVEASSYAHRSLALDPSNALARQLLRLPPDDPAAGAVR